MASLYTHDQFNKAVYECLPEEAKRKIEPYKEYYHFGSQGPDLFFYRLSSPSGEKNIGTLIHEHSFLDFWKPVESYVLQDSPVSAYLLGAALHFLVDVTVHPTVNSMVTETYSHIDIETELDRYYMLKQGEKPTSYPQWKLVARPDMAEEISKAYAHCSGVDVEVVRESIRDFRRIKKVLHSPSILHEGILSFAMKKMKKKSYLGLIMKQRPLPGARESNRPLLKKMEDAGVRAPKFMEEVLFASKTGKDYPPEFYYNFDGRKL